MGFGRHKDREVVTFTAFLRLRGCGIGSFSIELGASDPIGSLIHRLKRQCGARADSFRSIRLFTTRGRLLDPYRTWEQEGLATECTLLVQGVPRRPEPVQEEVERESVYLGCRTARLTSAVFDAYGAAALTSAVRTHPQCLERYRQHGVISMTDALLRQHSSFIRGPSLHQHEAAAGLASSTKLLASVRCLLRSLRKPPPPLLSTTPPSASSASSTLVPPVTCRLLVLLEWDAVLSRLLGDGWGGDTPLRAITAELRDWTRDAVDAWLEGSWDDVDTDDWEAAPQLHAFVVRHLQEATADLSALSFPAPTAPSPTAVTCTLSLAAATAAAASSSAASASKARIPPPPPRPAPWVWALRLLLHLAEEGAPEPEDIPTSSSTPPLAAAALSYLEALALAPHAQAAGRQDKAHADAVLASHPLLSSSGGSGVGGGGGGGSGDAAVLVRLLDSMRLEDLPGAQTVAAVAAGATQAAAVGAGGGGAAGPSGQQQPAPPAGPSPAQGGAAGAADVSPEEHMWRLVQQRKALETSASGPMPLHPPAAALSSAADGAAVEHSSAALLGSGSSGPPPPPARTPPPPAAPAAAAAPRRLLTELFGGHDVLEVLALLYKVVPEGAAAMRARAGQCVAAAMACEEVRSKVDSVEMIGPNGVLAPLMADDAVRGAVPAALKQTYLTTLFAELNAWDAEEVEDVGGATLCVCREDLLESSYSQLMEYGAEALSAPAVCLHYEDEEGYGEGVLRDWLAELGRRLFDPNNALFVRCRADGRAVHPNPAGALAHGTEDFSEYMRFAGRVLGLALRARVPLGVHLGSAFFRLLTGRPATAHCFHQLDPQAHSSCESVMSMPGAESLNLTFVASMSSWGVAEDHELLPGGAERGVTDANKAQYIALMTKFYCERGCQAAVDSFEEGLYDTMSDEAAGGEALALVLMPLDAALINEVIGGSLADIDVEDWRKHTSHQAFDDMQAVADVFWTMVASLPPPDRRRLLQFWTSYTHLPAGGFAALPSLPQLVLGSDPALRLPTSHTCFLQLNLPRIAGQTAAEMRVAFLMALDNSAHFGIE